MARPYKQRFVATRPRVTTFKPQGIPLDALEVLILSLDELEALRLADVSGDDQERAAAKMNISRPTFGRILERARRTVAMAVLEGKALEISGGPVTTGRRGTVRCRTCRRSWEVPVKVAEEFHCPRCPAG
jgi:predicted DNA-binding protein (UPF0251 family)